MARMLLLLSFFCVILYFNLELVSGAAFVEMLDPDPEHPGMCISASRGLRLNVGENQTLQNECATVSCARAETGGRFILEYIGCGVMAAPPGCRILENKRRRHPGCCPRMVCPD